MRTKYLHFSIFLGCKKRHGGTKRSEQLAELLNEQEAVSLNPYMGLKDSMFYALKHPLILSESILFAIYLFFLKGLSLKGIIKYSFLSIRPIILIKNYKTSLLILETSPSVSLVLMQYFKWKNIPFIAVPHNIEFLVPKQKLTFFRNLSYAFACEVDGYRAASSVQVICDYDRSILACLGISSRVFPYFPATKEADKFLNIRKLRKDKIFNNTLLILGTVSNKPTCYGIKSFLDNFLNESKNFKLIIAGYGTEQFKNYESSNISILGAIESERLNDLLINVRGLIINQPQTTGFLTKIVEFNLCGIPMIVTSEYMQADNLEKYGVYKISAKDFDALSLEVPSKYFEKPASNFFVASEYLVAECVNENETRHW